MSDSSSNGTAATGVGSLTAREQEILAKVMLCLKTPPEIDYQILANHLGMSNHRSASNAWSAIKKKLWANGEGPATPAPASKAKKAGGDTPATAKSTAKKRVKAEADDDNEDAESTPSKKPRGRKAAGATPAKAAGTAAAKGSAKKAGKKGKKADSDAEDMAMEDIPAVAAVKGEKEEETGDEKKANDTDADPDEDDTLAQMAIGEA